MPALPSVRTSVLLLAVVAALVLLGVAWSPRLAVAALALVLGLAGIARAVRAPWTPIAVRRRAVDVSLLVVATAVLGYLAVTAPLD